MALYDGANPLDSYVWYESSCSGNPASAVKTAFIVYPITGVTAASHTYKIKIQNDTAGTLTVYMNTTFGSFISAAVLP